MFNFFGGFFCMLMMFVDKDKNDAHKMASIILPLAGKFALTGGYGGIYVYSAELFPTQIRSFPVKRDFRYIIILKFMIQKLRNRSLLSGCANRRYRGSSHRHACSIWCRAALYNFRSSWFDRSPFIFIFGRSIRQAASGYG